jgi:hypothetical protein
MFICMYVYNVYMYVCMQCLYVCMYAMFICMYVCNVYMYVCMQCVRFTTVAHRPKVYIHDPKYTYMHIVY